MATKEPPAVGTRRVELVLGDMFGGGDAVVVVPCSTFGSIAPAISERLASFPISTPDHLNPGDVVPAWRAGAKGVTKPVVLLAAVVADDKSTRPEWVRSAAGRAMVLAEDLGRTIAFPLLGSGAGALPPADSVRAIVDAVGRSTGAVSARIYVLEQSLYDDLARLGLTADPAAPPQAKTASSGPKASSSSSAKPSSSSAKPSSSSQSADTAPPSSVGAGPSSVAEPVQAAVRTPRRDEFVPTHTDGPAVVDELGRQGFARVLARRIRDARLEEKHNNATAPDPGARRGGAFIIHLHAPWGAGKTSVLNFLAAELRQDDPAAQATRCVVVDFNAWRHQRIEPPWWWLMTALYSGAVRELATFDRKRAVMLRIREWIWRSKGGWPGYLALLAVAALVVLAWRTGWFGTTAGRPFSLDTFRGFLVTAAAIITPALTVWGLVHAMGRWVFSTSARGARRFIANTNDPMRLVQEHLADLTRWIHHDVVVMIDDLDRCKGPYVVELLEGIQTLFREIPVTYVIAADRDWLADSYADEYASFVSVSGEPGRPVGYLFLEKTFQISTGLPQATNRIDAFWERILRSPTVPGEHDIEQARLAAADALSGLPPDAVRREVVDNPGNTVAEIQARREVVAVEMVSERAQQANTHTLQPFRPLLGNDPNPRTMKRLVNAYGIARGIETLQGVNLEDDHLREQETALWTILSLRWPKLSTYLAHYPDRLTEIGATKPAGDIPAGLQPLFTDPEVLSVVQGDADGIQAKLTTETLRRITLP